MGEFKPLKPSSAGQFVPTSYVSETGFMAGLPFAKERPVPGLLREDDEQGAQGQQPIDVEAECQAARLDGLEEGRAEMAAEVERLTEELQALQPVLQAVAATRSEALKLAAADIGSIVEGLCRRLLNDHLSLDANALTALVQGAASGFPPEDDLTIRVPADVVEIVRSAMPDAKVVADDSVVAGCRIDTQYASVESTLETAMSGVSDAVRVWVARQG